jgi:hypothetical protein
VAETGEEMRGVSELGLGSEDAEDAAHILFS